MEESRLPLDFVKLRKTIVWAVIPTRKFREMTEGETKHQVRSTGFFSRGGNCLILGRLQIHEKMHFRTSRVKKHRRCPTLALHASVGGTFSSCEAELHALTKDQKRPWESQAWPQTGIEIDTDQKGLQRSPRSGEPTRCLHIAPHTHSCVAAERDSKPRVGSQHIAPGAACQRFSSFSRNVFLCVLRVLSRGVFVDSGVSA